MVFSWCYSRSSMEVKNILIIGAGKAGRLLENDIEERHFECRVVGFVDDEERQKSRVRILGKIQDTPKLLDLYRIDEIVIAIPSADGALVRRILLTNRDNRIPIRIVPRDQRIIGKSDVRYEEVKAVQAEDFLGRPFVRYNVERLTRFYRGKTVFVTGGAGSIGSEIVRQLLDLNVKRVVVYDNSEYLMFLLEQQLKERGLRDACELIVGSILHDNKLNTLFARLRPDIIFHAAAYKHVHLMQDNIDEAVYNNVIGTKRVIDAAVANRIPLLTFISTDKVVHPTSVMGATKKLCEYYIQCLGHGKTKFHIVRFGNVINSRGSALPLFERQMILHRYVTVTHKEMQRFFMSIREAAQLVIESTASGKTNSIYILNMGELLNIYEVALCLIRSKDFVPEKDIAINITGLRKGEKMVEELYTDGECARMRKKDEYTFTLKNLDKCPVDIEKVVDQLESIVKLADEKKELAKILNSIFPSLKNV